MVETTKKVETAVNMMEIIVKTTKAMVNSGENGDNGVM